MSVSLYSVTYTRTVLLLQLVVFVIIGALFFVLKNINWGLAAIAGGMAAWLPNVLFMFLAWRHAVQIPVKGRIAWRFAFAEALKVFVTIILLIAALSVFAAMYTSVGLTWLSVLMIQILAPAVINNKG